MIHILLLILKIIGIILLAILGILLISIVVVLFLPVQYQMEAKTEDGLEHLEVHAKAHWLLHLIYAYWDYEDKQSRWQVRIGWKKLNKKRKAAMSDEDKVDDIQEEREASVPEEPTRQEQSEKPKQGCFQKIKCTIKRICDKIKALLETKDKLAAFLTDETHMAAFGHLKKEILVFAKHIRPRRIKGYIRFGMEEPYNTGRVLAALSILYPFYGDNVQIYPEFERQILEGNLFMKGHISVCRFLAIVLRLYFDENIKRTYKNYKLLKS